jgi:F-type H+-transporting ATPase subunit delta
MFHPVARVYAEALFAIAQERSVVDEVGAELQTFLHLLEEEPEIDRFLDSPVLEPLVKVTHLKKAFAGNLSDLVADFLCLLVQKRRTSALPLIASAYRSMADSWAKRARVEVRSARPLTEPLRSELESLLRSSLNKEIALDAEVEPALMGGAVITIGDRVYDGTIRNRLAKFRKQMMRSSGYEAQG